MKHGHALFLSPRLDEKTMELRVIIETPKNSRNKFDLDPESGLFELAGVLPEGMMFPFDFGFIPSTLGEDGDPLDVMVFMDAPAHPGCIVNCRIVGIMSAQQTEKNEAVRNDRLLAVSLKGRTGDHILKSGDIDPETLEQVEEFFKCYNKQHGKTFKILGIEGPKKAVKAIRKGMRAFKKRH